MRQALDFVPTEVREAVLALEQAEYIEELRLRRGRRASCLIHGQEQSLPLLTTQAMVQETLERAMGQSRYTAQEMLRRGFLTLSGGHRLGICGTGVYHGAELYSLREISSLNLRIARPIRSVADAAANHLWTHLQSALIIGPPGSGKTTLLRDLIRQLSERFRFRMAVADERMELAACMDGKPQFDLGRTTDVLSGVPKEQAMEMLLRSMNPQWIAVDEITAAEDVQAIVRASYCGVRFLATAHAYTKEDLYKRPVYRSLLEAGIFETLVVLDAQRNIRMEGLTND